MAPQRPSPVRIRIAHRLATGLLVAGLAATGAFATAAVARVAPPEDTYSAPAAEQVAPEAETGGASTDQAPPLSTDAGPPVVTTPTPQVEPPPGETTAGDTIEHGTALDAPAMGPDHAASAPQPNAAAATWSPRRSESRARAVTARATGEDELGPALASGVVWIDAPLPDPIAPSTRLAPSFAHRLRRVSRRNGVPWELSLAVLRARGGLGADPAGRVALARLQRRLLAAGARPSAPARDRALAAGAFSLPGPAVALARYRRDRYAAVLERLSGDAAFAQRTVALALYYRAIGLRALVRGLTASKAALSRRVLGSDSVVVYAGGRDDIAAGHVDVRVLALMAYLDVTYGQVTFSSLISGHRLFARPGVVSAHIYGRAVDVAAVAGRPILGHEEPGSITENVVRAILLLPAELQPQQVISLLGLGGPSFPLADHYDHIHVGY